MVTHNFSCQFSVCIWSSYAFLSQLAWITARRRNNWFHCAMHISHHSIKALLSVSLVTASLFHQFIRQQLISFPLLTQRKLNFYFVTMKRLFFDTKWEREMSDGSLLYFAFKSHTGDGKKWAWGGKIFWHWYEYNTSFLAHTKIWIHYGNFHKLIFYENRNLS